MDVDTPGGERGFLPTPFLPGGGTHEPPSTGAALMVVVLGRDSAGRLMLSARPRDLSGGSWKPVAAQDSCDWCYSAATTSSRAESERLGLVSYDSYACDACLATEAYRTCRPDGLEEDAPWPFPATLTQDG